MEVRGALPRTAVGKLSRKDLRAEEVAKRAASSAI
jgi:acyl-CoA synthetase (AMP-forming)/AMP-acid ligase II